jgi:hypothetical protein
MIAAVVLVLQLGGAHSLDAGVDAREAEWRRRWDASVVQALFAEGRLWLRRRGGAVCSVAPSGERCAELAVRSPVTQLCAYEGRAAVWTESPAAWTIGVRMAGGWKAVATVDRQGDRLLAVSCRPDGIMVVTDRRLISVDRRRQDVVALTEKIPGDWVSALLVDDQRVFVARDVGEFGGDLRRIDRATGKVEIIVKNVPGAPCRGTLDRACDPVTGLATQPGKPGCVVVSVGLAHGTSERGRLEQVCPDGVKQLFARSLDLGDSLPFYGLLRVGDEVWVVGADGLYRLNGDGILKPQPLPAFQPVGDTDVAVSFDLPGVVLMRTAQARSREPRDLRLIAR